MLYLVWQKNYSIKPVTKERLTMNTAEDVADAFRKEFARTSKPVTAKAIIDRLKTNTYWIKAGTQILKKEGWAAQRKVGYWPPSYDIVKKAVKPLTKVKRTKAMPAIEKSDDFTQEAYLVWLQKSWSDLRDLEKNPALSSYTKGILTLKKQICKQLAEVMETL